ncbi:hypothetical protein OOK58_09560 [Streptomyces sp. NBC_01728]|uniref:hypothetical protein n=1 Tax=unclassified Streptomyces TaxID=2593676 RepID=UPI002253B9FC|nr:MULTISPECIES: hypothetical protein [unclassified Streptomyces]MCX4452359.1 hypothetical protein [Streptomyces sp. NBC_01719]MCX4491719.1 hypothetical protein [Streptomyces sp. NBC_01728]
MTGTSAAWVPDALMAGVDVLVTAVAVAGAVVLQARWLAALAGVWAVVALRQGWLAARAFKRTGG